jgi:hypothetical protein
MQERVNYLQNVLARLRVTASSSEVSLVSESYRTEVERMQSEIAEYLALHTSKPVPAEAA